MLRKILTIAATGVILAASVTPAFAQYPNVANLKPFSAETNFMSLPGYLRWLMFQQTGQWISYSEASRVVGQQRGQ